MRPILLNARAASRPELGGVERWAREMVARLPPRDERYVVARPPRALSHRAGHAWEQCVLPVRAARSRASLIMSPANLAPLAWPRNVVLIHDTAALDSQGWYSPTYVAWQRLVLPRIARGAQHVVTVSEFSRRQIIGRLGVPPARISVISGGVDGRFSPAADPRAARRALGLTRPYVLTVGSTSARKNILALEPAARRLASLGIDLVAAGGTRPQFRPPRRRAPRPLAPDRAEAWTGGPAVRRLGQVPDELLPGLYAGARAFVLVSLYEGFGLPCVEAMATGTPVVAADRTALPETCAGAALLVDPRDSAAICAAVERAVSDEPLRARMRADGLGRAAELSWERAATRMHDVLLAQAA